MQLVTLKFKGSQKPAPETMAGHNPWLEQGLADQVFLLSGSLDGARGGCIVADAESTFTPGRSRLGQGGLEAP